MVVTSSPLTAVIRQSWETPSRQCGFGLSDETQEQQELFQPGTPTRTNAKRNLKTRTISKAVEKPLWGEKPRCPTTQPPADLEPILRARNPPIPVQSQP